MQERGPVAEVDGVANRRRFLVLAGVAALVIGVDQWTKTLAVRHLADGPVDLFWTVRFNLSYNSGAAFGLGKNLGPFVVLAAAALLVVLLAMTRHVASMAAAIALGLVLGGALGNLVDRLFRDNGGAVIDFIDAQWWYVFNVADAAVVCGTILLLLTSARNSTPSDEAPPDETHDEG